MADPRNSKPRDMITLNWEMKEPDRSNLPSRPGTLEGAQWPLPNGEPNSGAQPQTAEPYGPQTLGIQFDGATGPMEAGIPPDTMGAVGPTQFFVFLNGRLRTFNKATGVADGAINANSDAFFASVVTPPGAGEISFTTDPQVRYDRLSGRWFLVMIDVTLDSSSGTITRPNRVLFALSDAASNGTITSGTVWMYHEFQGDASLFTDYPSLGIDASALYIGCQMLTLSGNFNSTNGYVIPKAQLLTNSSTLTLWVAAGLVATSSSPGPYAPRGVDNYDPNNVGATAQGYFIGVDNATFNTLMLRRVTNPGSVGPPPTISGNIAIATPLTTSFPVPVPHLGNNDVVNGRLDSTNDRLFAAHLRNGRLWTAHNIGVNNTGVAGAPASNNRNAARWYELQNLNATPSVLQSGTLFDNNAANDSNQRNYWIPSIMVSGQGHVALGCSIAGTNERINAFTTGRLLGDTLGTLRDGPGGVALPGYTASTTAYNPPADPGTSLGHRRWGDYSFVSLDPKDDMTMWTIQEYCNGTNTYGAQAVKLIAPLPVNPNSANPPNVATGQSSVNVVLSGASSASSGFYDPGTNLAPPALPFNHINATVNGGGVVVNSTTYNSPTQITLNINTTGASSGSRTVTVTNPDGQSVTSTAILNIVNSLQLTGAVSRLVHGGAGTFDIALPGVECRNGQGSPGKYTVVFTLSNPISSVNNVAVNCGSVASSNVDGGNPQSYVVNLTGVTCNTQHVTITLTGVNDIYSQTLSSASATMGLLIGDTTGDGIVNSGDVSQTKARSGSAVNGSTFRSDVTVEGTLNSGDISLVKSKSGTALPP